MPPRNILFIQTDQQRRDLVGAYGNTTVKTPNIDHIAAEGTLFEDGYTITPICAPARGSLLTGLYPVRHGALRNPESGEAAGWDFHPGMTTFGTMLQDAGYSVYHVGKWHVGRKLTPEDCGFKGVYHPGYGYPLDNKHPHYMEYLKGMGVDGIKLREEFFSRYPDGSTGIIISAIQEGPEEASITHYLASQVIDDIKEAAEIGKPFFVRMDFWGPHSPYIIPERYMRMYEPKDMTPWPNAADTLDEKPGIQKGYRRYWGIEDFTWKDWSRIVAACYGYTTLIDDAVGRVLNCLEELGLVEDTAVFFTSDHGGMVAAHGLMDKGPYLYDEICRVPLIVKMPGALGGRRVSGIAYNMDLMPAFLETAGIEIPDGLDATSLMPAVRGDADWKGRDAAYLEFHGHQCPYEVRVLRKDGWKYIFNAPETDELYDLESDPAELKNLVENPDAGDVRLKMREEMLERLRGFKDPIVRYFRNTRLRGR